MRALTVRPGEKESLELRDVPEPAPEEGSVLVDGLAVGLCGTDQEIVEAQYGQAPPGAEYLAKLGPEHQPAQELGERLVDQPQRHR